MRRPTVNDVAAEAGVSGKSVSRVVNGSPNISPELRRRVEAAVEKLGYVPNALARNLRIGVGDAVGVVIDAIADPFFASVTSTVETAALDAGLTTVIASTGFDPEREHRQVQRMAMQQVRALILAPVPRSHDYLRRYATGRPVVMIDRAVEVDGYDTVRVDDRATARAAVGHLLRAGHRRIAFVGYDPAFATLRDRLSGYREALAGQTDAPTDAELHTPTPETDADAVRLLTDLLAVGDPPTAVFAANTRAGSRMAYALHATGRAGLAFVSFGDFPLSQALRPPVTCVDHDARAIGRAAMACVLDRLGGDPGPPRDVLVEAALGPRGSGEIEATGTRVRT